MFELMSVPMIISDFVGAWPRRVLRVLRKQRYGASSPVFVHGW